MTALKPARLMLTLRRTITEEVRVVIENRMPVEELREILSSPTKSRLFAASNGDRLAAENGGWKPASPGKAAEHEVVSYNIEEL